MDIQTISTDWKDILINIVKKYNIDALLTKEIDIYNDMIIPKSEDIFHAFKYKNISDISVVILGQDCYPSKEDTKTGTLNLAHGLAFSVPNEITKIPPSLRNIFKELEIEYNKKRVKTDLSDWAQQGVLLLNTALTVREGNPGSHLKIWTKFTYDLMDFITKNNKNIVYILWGNHAKQYEELIDKHNNLVLTHTHPSPLSRKPFVGNNHFKLCNEYLKLHNKDEIEWI